MSLLVIRTVVRVSQKAQCHQQNEYSWPEKQKDALSVFTVSHGGSYGRFRGSMLVPVYL